MHARKQRFQILKKEIKDIQMVRKQAENKMQSLRNRVAGIVQYFICSELYHRIFVLLQGLPILLLLTKEWLTSISVLLSSFIPLSTG